MVQENHMQVHFDAKSVNEGLARMVVTAFMTNMNPTLEQIADVKTAVSEAVTNAIIHGYENLSGYTNHGEMRPAYSIIHPGKVRLHCILENDTLSIEVSDQGKGIEDVARAMEPLFTTKPELERSGMGFAFCQMMSERRYQPQSRSANASIHGIPIISFALTFSTRCASDTPCSFLPLGFFGSRWSPLLPVPQ